ncbi:hypothetical protein [Thiohalocapsa sp. ML1]|jgi:hypothetical protein|uniref:hypothetical protein n=1 Tax=Thiohalocapsa sp. ML1 TaxID=1431688 RepID=UPI0007321396|nr:hypothetical protein [Thiohalocapsa sp. ML1]
MVDNEAAALVIENIAMLEDAMALANGELGEEVFAEIDRVICHWADARGWKGKFSFWDDETSLWATEWVRIGEGEEQWIAWFELDAEDPDEDTWLTRLLGARRGRIGFAFHADLGAGKPAWKRFAREFHQAHPEIEKSGFEYNDKDGSWFLPFKVQAKALAEAYANDALDDAMEPLRDALERVGSVYPTFAELVEAGKRKFVSESAASPL